VSAEDRERGVTHLDRYLKWFYETTHMLRELLAENGSIFVHLDVHMGPYIKVLMDEVFGRENFLNQIAWYYYNKMHDVRKKVLPKAYDIILWYVKSRQANYTYNRLEELRAQPVKQLKRAKVQGKMVNVKDEEGRVVYQLRETRVVDNVWRIRCLQPANIQEWVGYETQKPADLIERIILLASEPNGLVLDCFVGSGSTAVAAERQGRRWIAGDLGRFAIHTTRKRLLGIPNVRPFSVQNLGKYERQAWQIAEFPNPEDQREREAAYRRFILDLYHATPISGRAWLHGTKNGRFVHIGAVDAPVTLADVKAVAAEGWKAAGSGKGAAEKAAADILGWEFAFELNETARDVAAQARVDIVFRKIPREVLEKKAVEQGDIRFFELAALSVEAKQKKRELDLVLKDFLVPPDDVPEDLRTAIQHWSQWIDYWAVDWDFKGDTFHNQWQSYRTRKDPKIETKANYVYTDPGRYVVVVKVIDILGNDTTKTLSIEVS
jgi:DNA modification methylase